MTSTPFPALERSAQLRPRETRDVEVGGVALVDPAAKPRAGKPRERCAPAVFRRAVRLLSASQWSRRTPPVALIAGPTASGKSALALALAEATGGVIVNADSAQIYRDLPILSAAPAAGRPQAAPSIGSTACATAPSPARRPIGPSWRAAEIAAIHAAGRLPILVGGTGLYLRTLLDGIAPVPPIDPADPRRSARRERRRESRGA